MYLTYVIICYASSIILLSSLSLFIYFLLISKKCISLTYDSIILNSKEDTQLLTKWVNEDNIKNISLLFSSQSRWV